jgi:hypothetical protein
VIFKKYGTSYHSVDTNFESKALNEIGFRKDKERVVAVEEFQSTHEHLTTHELTAEADGPVQDHTEQLLLDRLESRLLELEASLDPHCVLVIDNGDGPDWPKTKQHLRNTIVDGENRLHFEYTVAPALRMAVYAHKKAEATD